MKIAMFHELDNGGARRAANEFAKNLKKNNTVDLFIVDNKSNKNEKVFYSSIYFYKFIPRVWEGNNWVNKLYKDTVELIKLYSFHKKIAKEIDRKKYDLVFIMPSRFTQAPFVMRFVKTKQIYYCLEPLRIAYDPTVKIPDNLSKFRYLYEKTNRSIRKSIDMNNVNKGDFFIALSVYSAKLFTKIYKKSIDVIYCGVDTSFFTSKPIGRQIDILFVGSSQKVEGYNFFKEVIENIRTEVKVKEVISEKRSISDVELRDLYRSSKIIISASYNEPLGLIPLEAMACECVVIAVSEGGYKETVIDKKTGFLFSRNPKKFAEKIDWLLSNPKRLNEIGILGKNEMQNNWDWRIQSKKLEDYIHNVVFKVD